MNKVTSIGRYRLKRLIGKGSFAKVYLGLDEVSLKKVAVKVIKKSTVVSELGSLKSVRREVAIHKLLDHPNIVSLKDVHETSKRIFIIMEYVPNGELFDLINSRDSLSRPEALKFFQQIFFAVEYCSVYRITHRDIKPENLLLDKDYNIKLTDFGMARVMHRNSFLKSQVGSPHYVAPEILGNRNYSGDKSTVWSLGVILYVLLCGYMPFDEKNRRRLFTKISRGEYTIPESLSANEADIIKRMLTVDPDERISLQEIKKHPYFWQNLPPNIRLPMVPRLLFDKPIRKCTNQRHIIRELVMMDLGYKSKRAEKKIISKLMSRKPNEEKTFYHLYMARAKEREHLQKPRKKRRESLLSVFGDGKGGGESMTITADASGMSPVEINVKSKTVNSFKSYRKKYAKFKKTYDDFRVEVMSSEESDLSSLSGADDAGIKKKGKWSSAWFYSLFSKRKDHKKMLSNKLKQFRELLERQDSDFNIKVEDYRVIWTTPLPLVQVVEILQFSLVLKGWTWEFPNMWKFIISKTVVPSFEQTGEGEHFDSSVVSYTDSSDGSSSEDDADDLSSSVHFPVVKLEVLIKPTAIYYPHTLRYSSAGLSKADSVRESDPDIKPPDLHKVIFVWISGPAKALSTELLDLIKVLNF